MGNKISFILTVLLLIYYFFSYYLLPGCCRKEVLVLKGGKFHCFPYFRLPECYLKENTIFKREVPLDPSSHRVSLNSAESVGSVIDTAESFSYVVI